MLSHLLAGDVLAVPATPLTVMAMSARLYTPIQKRAGPPILFFHGGGFVSCDLDTHDALCRRLAQASGLRVLAPAYRLAPEHPAPAQVEDAVEACRWALRESALLENGTGKIIVAGDSAGSYLAVQCSLALNRQQQNVAAQLLFYPLLGMDLEHGHRSHWPCSRWLHRMAMAFIREHIGAKGYPSLLSTALGDLPKTIVVSGRTLDPVFSDNKAFATLLKMSGVPVEHIILPHLFHGALNVARLSRTARRAIEESVRAMERLPC
jgi:acetyl esterase